MPVPKTPLPDAVRAAAVPAIGGEGEQCASVDGGVQRQTTTTAAILIPRVSLSSAPTTFSTEGEARCSTGPRHLRRAEGPGGSFSVGGVGAGAQAGLKALYTCTSWYAYAAMSGSSTRSMV